MFIGVGAVPENRFRNIPDSIIQEMQSRYKSYNDGVVY